jgi:hypothetical protein
MDRALEDGLVSENNIIIVVDSVDGLVDYIMKTQVSDVKDFFEMSLISPR